MRCLKRFIARDVFHNLFGCPPVRTAAVCVIQVINVCDQHGNQEPAAPPQLRKDELTWRGMTIYMSIRGGYIVT